MPGLAAVEAEEDRQRTGQGRQVAREYRLKPKIIVPEGVTLDLPGIYEWAITYTDGSVQRYVGKYTRRSRPTREYHANVERILDKRSYRKAIPDGFRRVHRELAAATSEGRAIVLTILENAAPEDLNRREQALIRARGATLNGVLQAGDAQSACTQRTASEG